MFQEGREEMRRRRRQKKVERIERERWGIEFLDPRFKIISVGLSQ